MLGAPSMFTCPECHGTLMWLRDERVHRFRCHTGHACAMRSLLVALSERTEDALSNSIRAIEESAMRTTSRSTRGLGLVEELRGSSAEELRRARRGAQHHRGGANRPAEMHVSEIMRFLRGISRSFLRDFPSFL